MKKRMVCALLAILVFAAIPSFAEDMPVIAWDTPAPETATQTGEITDSATSSLTGDMPLLVWKTPAPEIVMQTGEITDSWEEIIAAIDDGSASLRYAVGATKALDLGDLGTVHMQLAGFDLDDRADGQGKAATTWIAVELLPESRCMNEEWTAAGGWRDSDLRKYLQDTVLPVLPSLIRKHIRSVIKSQRADGKWQTSEDVLWIPDHDELFGNTALYYGLFLDTMENRVKHMQGFAAWWWLRSGTDDIGFGCVSSGGSYYGDYAHYSGGVAVGFCL